jgi:hypothetical protein
VINTMTCGISLISEFHNNRTIGWWGLWESTYELNLELITITTNLYGICLGDHMEDVFSVDEEEGV